ncbi:hypothetical protein [Bradyrhizobium sp.]|jgi:hypothetical protein|uniref:hypothetical protein n=1 Tax=Bradyrhizobium sp. TaxID=376 RepID=UPI002D3D15FC|nr:hypothetical protein [Bradyrhizobium sp.]HZR72707.1 hypothetical protein [Bradyrhizobium sp.]
MLEMIFGFNARLGRLHYFLGSLAFGVLNMILAIPFVFYLGHLGIRPTTVDQLLAVGWPAYAFVAFYMFGHYTLAAMRVRDIGWDPVIVITGWIVLAVMHHYFGARVPALGIVAGLVNLGLWLILLFWPSGDHVVSPPSFDDYKPRSPDRGKPASVASQRFAKASGQFGRRA